MNKELLDMIKSSQLTVEQFYLMHPFSSSSNILYNKILKDINFFKEFYTLSNKTFDNLVDIANVANNTIKNTIIITGYRGCGKTNFLRYCDAIINNKETIKNFKDVYSEHYDFLKKCKIETFINKKGEKTTLKDEYTHTLECIKNKFLNGKFKDMDNDEFEKKLSLELSQELRGKSEYINFGEGKVEDNHPMKLRTVQVIENDIESMFSDGKSEYIFKELINFYYQTKKYIKNSFEDSSGWLKIDAFIEYLNAPLDENIRHLYKCTNYSIIEKKLRAELAKLDSDQLLFIMLLIKLRLNSKNEKNYFLFDNIDMVSDDKNILFSDTIASFWNFVKETRSFADDLRKENICTNWVIQFENCKFIFAMRETTAMHICDDLRERVKLFLKHFDISNNINFNLIVNKKYLYFKYNLNGFVCCNTNFLDTMKYIYEISLDPFFIKHLFPLFNNDYRTAMRCLYVICCNHFDEISHALELIRSRKGYLRYGGRGIIYRLIFDKFETSGYLKGLDIYVKSGKYKYAAKHDFSFPRIILTVLENIQKDYGSSFFVNPEESVSLETLFEFVKIFIADSPDPENEFVHALNQMYALRNKSYWNHLITFDNLFSFDTKEMEKIMKDPDSQKREKITLRTTLAGKKYLQRMCVHFEFFSCRFCEYKYKIPLFSTESMRFNEQDNMYFFEKIIVDVFNAFNNCCNKLRRFNKLVFRNGIYDSSELPQYFHNNLFHEERIIHNHISYIDAFRRYIINEEQYKDISKDLNKKLINLIKPYLNLLVYKTKDKQKYFYSHTSENIYTKLGECIEKIEKSNYADITTEISLDYYAQNIEGEL